MPKERLDKAGGKNLYIRDKKTTDYLRIPTGDFFDGDFSMPEEIFEALDDNDECRRIYEDIQKTGKKIFDQAGSLPYSF